MLPTQSTIRLATNPLTFAIEDSINCDPLFPDAPIKLIVDYVGAYPLVPPGDIVKLAQAIATTSDKPIPQELVKIIAEYRSSDYAIALQDFETDKDGKITNEKTYAAIKNARYEALISHECNPVIKRIIFFKSRFGRKRDMLKSIINEIREKGYRLMLDGTNLSGFDLSGFNFSGMSAVNAVFSGTLMRSTTLERVDFTDAHIERSLIIKSSMTKSIFVRARLDGSLFNHVDLSGANVCDAVAIKAAHFYETNVSGLITNNTYLKASIGQITNKSKVNALLHRVKLTGAFSTESGFDKEVTASMIKEVTGLEKDNVAYADSSCTVS